ncbi:MAG: hypothetical protein R6W78_05720, partial [Bacteroidales bacterium]
MKKYCLVVIAWFCFTAAFSQTLKEFSTDPARFIDDLEYFMGMNIPLKTELILKDFKTIWGKDTISALSPEEQEAIIELSNLMLKQKFNSEPHFKDFLQTIISINNSGRKDALFSPWHQRLLDLIDKRKVSTSKAYEFIKFPAELLDSGYIFYSSSTIWKSKARDYIFVNEKKEFYVQFGKTDLTCYAKRDSISIFSTGGRFEPIEKIWTGSSGLVTWERGGYNRDSVFAILAGYTINMSKSEYVAENVVLTNKYFFDKSLTGTLTDKVKYIQSTGDATYPQFDSYQKDFFIKDLYENVNYEGGLSMQGSKLVGTGTRDRNAFINIFRNDTLLVQAQSGYFAFRADRVIGINTSVTIDLKRDSIFHPGLDFRFMVKEKELTLSRSDKFTSQSPFFNSYHNIDMSAEQLSWKINEPLMHFKATIGAATGIANFESVNFFNYGRFTQMQGMDDVHPLILIRSFARKEKSDEFHAEDFANYLRLPVHLVKQMLMRMSVAGFVFYDSNTEMVVVKPKLHTYIAASVAKIDYDVISIPSRTNAPVENAVFDLRTFDLTINGIPRIFVSDSQNVAIFPHKERIVMKKNRDFQFDGTVVAGLFTFEGNNFFFSYDSFKINLQNVDVLRIKYLTGAVDSYGRAEVGDINNVIQHVTGELLIDKPNNKSGRENFPEYPIFISKESSYVFYERPDIQSGVYDQNEFYYEIYPYTMDSLNNFNRNSISYQGEFISAGILPPIAQTLSLQKDKSLGFKYNTPAEGLPLYGGKGKYISEIAMTNSGLRGKGTINYLTSVTHSDDILFFPDSLNANATDFTIAKKTTEAQYPQVSGKNDFIHWLPYADEMYAYKKDIDFKMFNDSTRLLGNLKLEPKGLSGRGRMDLKNSDIVSDRFTYKADEIFADTSDFYLKSLHSTGFTILTDNVKSHINYTSRKGYFNSNEDYTLVNFTENRYVSYLDYFIWDMDRKELEMGARKTTGSAPADTSEDTPSVGPTYISVHPRQDSLNFVSPLAYYDYSKNLLKATEVKYIDVADARIYPDKGNVTVESDARMQSLENSRVKANMVSKFHKFHSSTINIYGRKKYDGFANYDYVDENNEVQNIHFKNIGVDENLQTIASGEIFEPDNFSLSPNYLYMGKVFLEAQKQYLTFKGGVKIEHNCDKIEPKWLDFTCEINPGKIYIPLPEQPLDINRQRIYAGLFMYYDSVHIYPAFLTPRKNYSDRAMLPVSGFLYYDKPSQLYKIASMEKLYDREVNGNYLSLHREECEMYGEGILDPGFELGLVKTNTAGNFRHNIINNTTFLDVAMGFDFFIHDDIINIMANDLDSIPNAIATDLNRITYNRAISELAGKAKAQAFKDELNLFGTVKSIPEGLKHTILFNDLKLEWNSDTRSYMSIGKIGIGSISNTQINKLVDGFIEIQVKRSGDICDIYLEIENKWYYFGYTRGVMQVLSSNKAFLDPIIALKPKDRKQKISGKSQGMSYIYMVSTD